MINYFKEISYGVLGFWGFGVKSHSPLLTEYRNSTKGKMMTSLSFLELVQLQNLSKKKKMRKQKMNKKKDNL